MDTTGPALKSVCAGALGALLALADAAAGAQSSASLEYQVKAAFLLNFIAFTEWPSDAFGPPGSPLSICVLGPDPFGATLDGTVKGETALGRPIVVERHANVSDGRRCHLAFIANRRDTDDAGALRVLDGAPVLTVGESPAFLRNGGMVNLVVEQGHVRFDVNRGAAEKQRLRLSSRLLRLARSVS